ncbi:MAG: YdeI/OmpD-associated family protein [Tahibacter sp.]
MATTDPRIDDYIAKSAEFARPILEHLRKLVHKACPDVEETLKWSSPHFMYYGMLAGMAAFKQHCAFGFWKASLIEGAGTSGKEAMGQFGRISSRADLPSDKILIGMVKQAMQLNQAGVKAVRNKTGPRKPIEAPDYFLSALRKQRAAWNHYHAFSPSQQRDYLEWITEAKTDVTRDKRLATALEWLGEGKTRNWKYEKC